MLTCAPAAAAAAATKLLHYLDNVERSVHPVELALSGRGEHSRALEGFMGAS